LILFFRFTNATFANLFLKQMVVTLLILNVRHLFSNDRLELTETNLSVIGYLHAYVKVIKNLKIVQ